MVLENGTKLWVGKWAMVWKWGYRMELLDFAWGLGMGLEFGLGIGMALRNGVRDWDNFRTRIWGLDFNQGYE